MVYTKIECMINAQDLAQQPPEEEPMRQYWFMGKARGQVKELSKKAGRPLFSCTVNMGCQMNTERETRKTA